MTEPGINLAGWVITINSPLEWLISGLLLLSLVLTLRACWRRLWLRNRLRTVITALLNLVAFFTVFVLLTEPQRPHLAERDILLITEGTDTKFGGLADSTNVYVAPGVMPDIAFRNADWLLDAAQLELREPALTSIDVRGYGLTRRQWQTLPNDIQLNFQPPPVSGFTGMSFPRTLIAGETIRIDGRYTDLDSDTGTAGESIIQLRLLDPTDRVISEARIRNGDGFSHAVRPKSAGNLAYVLQAMHGETLLSEQLLTVSVNTAAAISIMVEQSAPSFETRQLKNYAASTGASVLINTQISRGKYISQSANLPDNSETTFSPQLLASQDVLIMDGRAVVNLSGQQLQWLQDAIEQGLGLMVLADASLLEENEKLPGGLFEDFELSPDPDASAEAVPRLLSNPASDWQQPLPVTAIRLDASTSDVLIDDGNDHALVINKAIGLGHIAINRISQSHRWLTSGNRGHWSDYWAALISAVGRPRNSSYLLAADDAVFYQAGESIPVCAMSVKENLVATIIPPDIGSGQTAFEVALVRDSLGSPRQCGVFQASHSGWHNVQLRSGANGPLLDQQGLHVTNKDQWLAHKRQQRVNATSDRLAFNRPPILETPEGKWVSEPINNTWLWLLLVLTASLLWLERKLDFEW